MKSIKSIVNEMEGGEAIDFLIKNEDFFVVSQEELSKVKAEAVLSVLDNCELLFSECLHESAITEESIKKYASRLERGG